MTNQEKANAILSYIAQNLIAPMSESEQSTCDYWFEIIGEPFNKLCQFVRKTLDK